MLQIISFEVGKNGAFSFQSPSYVSSFKSVLLFRLVVKMHVFHSLVDGKRA